MELAKPDDLEAPIQVLSKPCTCNIMYIAALPTFSLGALQYRLTQYTYSLL